MEPSVPFALLAAVSLLSVAAVLGIAGAAITTSVSRVRTIVLVLAALALASADGVTGATLGRVAATPMAILRGAGVAVLLLGLVTVTWSGKRLILSGLLAQGVAAGLGPVATHHPSIGWGPVILRGVGALIVVIGLTQLVRRSVLAKVVSAILASVVLTAIGAAAVAGIVVAASFGTQQAGQIRQVATAERTDLKALRQEAVQLAQVIASGGSAPAQLARAVNLLRTEVGFAVQVDAHGKLTGLDGTSALDAAALADVARQGPVIAALRTSGAAIGDFVIVHGAKQSLLALGIAAPPRSRARPLALPPYVIVYGLVIDDSKLAAARNRSNVDGTLLALPNADILASSLPKDKASVLAKLSLRRGLLRGVVDESSVPIQLAVGNDPSAGYVLLQSGTDPLAVLVVSQPADVVLRTQRLVLTGLFAALVVIALAVAGVAYALGRRVVDPVRRLTAAATAVQAGDLTATSTASGADDEVGELSRAFDAMTASLALTTDELRATAEEEAATRARLQTVVNAMSDALVVIDDEGVVADLNPAAARLLGASAAGAELDGLLLAAAPDGAPLPLGDAVGRDGRYSGGGYAAGVAVLLSVSPLPSLGAGRGRGSVVVLRDVTREREIDKMKTEFLSNVSHELRTPITPIRGFAEMIAGQRELSRDQTRKFAATILDSTTRLTRVVEQLVDVAALEAGRVVPAPAPVAVRDFLDDRLDTWRERLPARATDLRRRVAAGLPDLLVDARWLAKALDELVDNALKFSQPGKPVTLVASLERPPGRKTRRPVVRIAVIDRGPGLDPATAELLLGDFTQADASMTRPQEGLGLGLSFVRRLGPLLGVTLTVDSAPGKGASFALDVPAAKKPR